MRDGGRRFTKQIVPFSSRPLFSKGSATDSANPFLFIVVRTIALCPSQGKPLEIAWGCALDHIAPNSALALFCFQKATISRYASDHTWNRAFAPLDCSANDAFAIARNKTQRKAPSGIEDASIQFILCRGLFLGCPSLYFINYPLSFNVRFFLLRPGTESPDILKLSLKDVPRQAYLGPLPLHIRIRYDGPFGPWNIDNSFLRPCWHDDSVFSFHCWRFPLFQGLATKVCRSHCWSLYWTYRSMSLRTMARRYKERFCQAMASKVIHIPTTLIPRSKIQFLSAFDLVTSRSLSIPSQRTPPSSKIDVTEIKEPVGGEIQEINGQQSNLPALSSSHQAKTVKPRRRTIPPFIFSHDVPRGVLYAAQMLISYLLMLAIMSVFQTRL